MYLSSKKRSYFCEVFRKWIKLNFAYWLESEASTKRLGLYGVPFAF